jgi:hypothetical protein
MADEQAKKPDLKLVPEEELDEEEREFRALRRDVPGVKGASEVGMLTISVGKAPSPKNIYYRTHKTFRPVMALVITEVGMDKQFIAVMPNMIEPLNSMGITTADHTLYLTVTPEGGLRVIPVRCPNEEGVQNEWDRTKEEAMIKGIDGWHRLYSDKANNAYKTLPHRPAGSASPTGRTSSPPGSSGWRSRTKVG